MQSPFQAVKMLGGVFRQFSKASFAGGSVSVSSFGKGTGDDLRTSRKGYHTSAGNEGNSKVTTGVTMTSSPREGSLFCFAAASSSLFLQNPVTMTMTSGQPRRHLWGWLNSVFNRVDESRIKEVGPDRACAEWLLRCGAGVKWDKGPDDWLRDYNSLPVGNYRALKIVEIDATDSAVMHIGFPHFKGLKHVKKLILHRCGYLEDSAVSQLGYLKDTLEHLQISSCGNVSEEGLLTLVQLKNLKTLKLYDFLEVNNRQKLLSTLQAALPKCQIDFPFAKESDRDPPKKNQESG